MILKKGQTFCFAVAMACLVSPVSFAATEVPTEKVLTPEEDATEAKQPKADIHEEEEPSGIPTEEIPRIDEDPTVQPATEPDDGEPAEKTREATSPPPPVQRDVSKLPPPVRRMHELLLTTARSGNIEKLRDLIGFGETATTLSIGGLEGDPIAFLKEASGDAEGFEILAILTEVLETGFVHLDAGTDEELYVWPYFIAWSIDQLTPEMKVELYSVLTAGDVEDSQNFGGYIFYRVGIKPDGTWSFFVAGD